MIKKNIILKEIIANCTGQMYINSDKLEKLIIISMKIDENPETKARGYLLSIGWTGLGEMTAKEKDGKLYCYPKGLEPFNPDINEIPIEATLIFNDGQIIYVMANYGSEVLRNRTPRKYDSNKGDLPLAT